MFTQMTQTDWSLKGKLIKSSRKDDHLYTAIALLIIFYVGIKRRFLDLRTADFYSRVRKIEQDSEPLSYESLDPSLDKV